MKVILEGEPKEVAALVFALQERHGEKSSFVPETADGPCLGTAKVAATASC